MMRLSIFVLTLIFLAPTTSQAQFLKRIKKAAQKKIEQKVAHKIEEEISEEIARRAMKPINEAFDEYIKASYETENGEQWDQSKFDSMMTAASASYVTFIEGMNKAANVPEQYVFDVTLDIETEEESKEKQSTQIMFSKTEGHVAFYQKGSDQDMIMVMDTKNDVLVMYNQEKKTAQAVPSAFSLTRSLADTYVEETDYKLNSFEETGKTKKIAGYNSEQYKGETKESKFTGYFSDELPFDWTAIYGDLFKSLSPKVYDDYASQIKGMMMQSETYDKETKKTSKWEVTNVNLITSKINKSDYKFPGVEK